MKNSKYLYILSVLFCSLFMFSCEEEETISEVKVDRLFRPVGFAAYISGVDVTLAWTPIKNASYLMEISKDSLLFENELQQFEFGEEAIDGSRVIYVIEDYCWSNTRYSARVKSISADPDVEDSGWQEVTFVTGSEETFYSIPDDNIRFDWVLLNWIPGKNVDKLIVSTAGAADVSISLTADEIAAGEKLIENLNPGTKYTFIIYLGERPRGAVSAVTYKSFTTVYVDQTPTGGAWFGLGKYYLKAGAGAYVEIRNDNTTGIIIADAFKFSKVGYDDIIVDNTDQSVIATGTWSSSSSSTSRIGDNYWYTSYSAYYKSVKYVPNLPVTGVWTVSMYWNGGNTRDNNVPVDIFAGN